MGRAVLWPPIVRGTVASDIPDARPGMYAAYIVRRTQIYLDDAQDRALAARAAASGTTKSAVIRHAVDAYLAQPEDTDWKTRIGDILEDLKGHPVHFEPDVDGAAYVDYYRAFDLDREKELAW